MVGGTYVCKLLRVAFKIRSAVRVIWLLLLAFHTYLSTSSSPNSVFFGGPEAHAFEPRLVHVRNPWGSGKEWQGRFSDGDAAWSEVGFEGIWNWRRDLGMKPKRDSGKKWGP